MELAQQLFGMYEELHTLWSLINILQSQNLQEKENIMKLIILKREIKD